MQDLLIAMMAVCMAGVGAMLVGAGIVMWKLDRYDTERYMAISAKFTPHDAKDSNEN